MIVSHLMLILHKKNTVLYLYVWSLKCGKRSQSSRGPNTFAKALYIYFFNSKRWPLFFVFKYIYYFYCCQCYCHLCVYHFALSTLNLLFMPLKHIQFGYEFQFERERWTALLAASSSQLCALHHTTWQILDIFTGVYACAPTRAYVGIGAFYVVAKLLTLYYGHDGVCMCVWIAVCVEVFRCVGPGGEGIVCVWRVVSAWQQAW